MWKSIKTIFGIPSVDMTAGMSADRSPKFLPESRLTQEQIHGVGADGSTWSPWRIDGMGEQWYERISRDDAGQQMIHGIADGHGDLPESSPEDSDSELSNELDSIASDAIQGFRRKLGVLRAQYERGEIQGREDDQDDEDEEGCHV